MSNHHAAKVFRPMNVVVCPGSSAEKHFRSMAALPALVPEPEARVPGLPATPSHNLKFHGGKTLAHLSFANRYVGGAAAWSRADIDQVDQALAKAMADRQLNNVIQQYFKGTPITSTFKGSAVLTGAPPARFSQGDVEKLVSQLFAAGDLHGLDLASTVVNFLLPSGSVLTTDGAPSAAHASTHPIPVEDKADSLNGLGGFHGSVHVNAATTVYYAIGVYSERLRNGQLNGIVAFDAPWKNIAATFYHELCEARTDPDVEDAIRAGNDPAAVKFLGWVSAQGEECGDFPVFESAGRLSLVMREVALADGSGKVPVQFQYSNAVRGPEGPIAKPH